MTKPAAAAVRLPAAMLLASIGFLAAGCSSSGSHTASSASSRAAATVTSTPSASSASGQQSASASGSPSPGGPAACPTASLRVALGTAGGAAGSSYYPIELTNISSVTCTLYGYPGVSFVTAPGGSQIGATATENPAGPRQLVTLAAGATASALLQVVNAQNYPAASCKPVTARWLQVYPPGQTQPLDYSFSALACSAAGGSVHSLSVEAVRPGRTGQ